MRKGKRGLTPFNPSSEAELATKNDLDKLEIRLTGELNLVKWMLGAILALAIANFVKQFL